MEGNKKVENSAEDDEIENMLDDCTKDLDKKLNIADKSNK